MDETEVSILFTFQVMKQQLYNSMPDVIKSSEKVTSLRKKIKT